MNAGDSIASCRAAVIGMALLPPWFPPPLLVGVASPATPVSAGAARARGAAAPLLPPGPDRATRRRAADPG